MTKKLRWTPDYPKTFQEAEELLADMMDEMPDEMSQFDRGKYVGLSIGFTTLLHLRRNLDLNKLRM